MGGVQLKWAGVLVVTRLLLLWHSANRATRAFQVDSSSATVCPFHLQDGRFTAPTQHTQHFACIMAKSEWTCRFCSVAKALAFSLCGECNSTRGRSFLRPFTYSGSDSHTPTRQPNKENVSVAIRIAFGISKFLRNKYQFRSPIILTWKSG